MSILKQNLKIKEMKQLIETLSDLFFLILLPVRFRNWMGTLMQVDSLLSGIH